MLQIDFLRGYSIELLIDFALALLAGFIIGTERESRGKPAGVSTHSFVIGGAMLFTYISAHVDPNSTSRIAAQLVTGVGFLAAGIILKSEAEERITNLTTAVSIWFSVSIDMAIGFDLYIMTIIAISLAALIPMLSNISWLRNVGR